MTRLRKSAAIAALTAAAWGLAWAADPAPPPGTPAAQAPPVPATGAGRTGDAADWSDRTRMKAFEGEKDRLAQKLEAGTSRESYRAILEQEGYRVTAINADSPEALEYEVVKGDQSYEVQLGFEGAGAAKSIDVAMNIWRAESTERAMTDGRFKDVMPAYDQQASQLSRDSVRMQAGLDEKESLQARLAPGRQADDYKVLLQDGGWKVTSTNAVSDDSIEYEVVKGAQSYEVQIDLDPATRVASEVEVSTNIWQSKETEQALGQE